MIIKLLFAFGVLTVVALMTMAILRRRDDGTVDSIWQSLEFRIEATQAPQHRFPQAHRCHKRLRPYR
jgi:hypothetical protein